MKDNKILTVELHTSNVLGISLLFHSWSCPRFDGLYRTMQKVLRLGRCFPLLLLFVFVCFSFLFCLFVSFFVFCPILLWKLTAHYINNNVGWLFLSFPSFFFIYRLLLTKSLENGLYQLPRTKIATTVLWIGTLHGSASKQPCSLVRNTENPGDCFPILLT